MAAITYRNYTNASHPFLRGYRHGDVLIAGWAGTLDVENPSMISVAKLAERLYIRHNGDDRPDGQSCPSMSVGDVVVISETAVSVEGLGFTVCTIDAADIVADLTWLEWITTPQAAAIGEASR